MSKYFLIIFLLIKAQSVHSQTFINRDGGIVWEDDKLHYFPIEVKNLPKKINKKFGLVEVCFSIQHEYLAQLDIVLKSPSGEEIPISNNRGSFGHHFKNTCIREDAKTHISMGVAPFSGNFTSDGDLNLLNNGQNPNGTWYLGIRDEIPVAVQGELITASLTFGKRPPKSHKPFDCSTTNASSCNCPDGTQNCELLPDMTISTQLLQKSFEEFPGYVRVGVATPNIGYGPLEVRAVDECFCDSVRVGCDSSTVCLDGRPRKTQVVQRVYQKNGKKMAYKDYIAGFMEFHSEHKHLHVDDWSHTSVRINNGNKDPLTWPVLGTVSKFTFCLINLYPCSDIPGVCQNEKGDTIMYNDVGNPGLGTETGCGPTQGIFPGYTDYYSAEYPGQHVMLGDVSNGWYYLVSAVDPKNHIKEMNDNNNVSIIPIRLSKQPITRANASFNVDTTIGLAPFTVNFSDASAPMADEWLWDFGDGTTSTEQSPTHIYEKPGVYNVKLSIRGKDINLRDTLVKSGYIAAKTPVTPENPHGFGVYYNEGKYFVDYSLKKQAQASVKVFDANGKMVYFSGLKQLQMGNFTDVLYLEKLEKGRYKILLETTDYNKETYIDKQ